MTLSDLNKQGEERLKQENEASSTDVRSTKISVEDMVEEGMIENDAPRELNPAEQMVANVFSVENISNLAKERMEREYNKALEEAADEAMDELVETTLDEEEDLLLDDKSNDVNYSDTIDEEEELRNEVLSTPSSNVVLTKTEEIDTQKASFEKQVEQLNTEAVASVDSINDELSALDELTGNSDADDSVEQLKVILQDTFKQTKRDLSKFKVSNKDITGSSLINNSAKSVKAAEWALMRASIPVTTTELLGDEIDILSSIFESRSEYTTVSDYMRGYDLMYKHTMSDKAENCLSFIKKISYYDLNHWFFALYNSNFAGSNYIPYNCEADKYVFLSKDTKITSMCKFKNDAAQNKFYEIVSKDPRASYTASALYKSEIIAISDDYAVEFCEPSIYSMTIEPMIITDPKFRQNHASMISFLPYIGTLYKIIDTEEGGELRPISFKEYPTDRVKNQKSKVLTYEGILAKVSTDDYSSFIANLEKFRNDIDDELSYVLPATACEKCGADIAELPMSGANLLFTRHRLPLIANTSVK